MSTPLETTTDRVAFAGNGVTTAFSFPYLFYAEADLVIIVKTIATGVEVVKTLTTHYTTTGAGLAAGGTITMLTAPTALETLIILRDKSAIQELEITDNGKIPSENLIKQLNKIVMQTQRSKNILARSVRLPEGYIATFDPKLPGLPVLDGFLKLNSAGTALEYTTGTAPSHKTIVGTRAVPIAIVAATGILFTSVSWETTMFVEGSGGAVIVTAAARIQAGTVVGQRLVLIGRSANSVSMADGNGIITGGQTLMLVENSVIEFEWDGVNWVLKSTNGLM